METIIMSKNELNTVSVMERLKEGFIDQKSAAIILKLSVRQVRNKIKRYREEGPSGLAHKNRGNPSNRSWNPQEKARAIIILKDPLWFKFGPTFAQEKLGLLHGIHISVETVRQVMIKEGLFVANSFKPEHRSRRERKSCIGVMIQLDGSYHDWFEGRGPNCCLLVFIDDATSEILWLEFGNAESTLELMQATYGYFSTHGKPYSLYVDRASVFKISTNNPDNERLSQFQRAMGELDVTMIFAGSPQAKGRVERFNQTAQDRLIKEMRLAGISSIQDANKFVHDVYIPMHNNKFAIAPALPQDLHRSVAKEDLHRTLAIKDKRIVASDYTVRYNNRFFQVERQIALVRPKDSVIISSHLTEDLSMSCRGRAIIFTEIPSRPLKPVVVKTVSNKIYKPAPNHPWRTYAPNHVNRPQMEVISVP
jgi:hypothetical protein